MKVSEAIEILKRQLACKRDENCGNCYYCYDCPNYVSDDEFIQALHTAISALENQSRIITVTDAEGGLLASISDKDIIGENGVHVIISEE